jgi:hypothetical protein
MYLEREKEEIDLIINRDLEETLTTFCKCSTRINPITSHPNHHDIAVLVTKHYVCSGSDDCLAVGLANIAGCCGKSASCAICEETRLAVGTVMTHEIGHLLDSDHDSDDDNPPLGMRRSSRQTRHSCHGIMVSGFSSKLVDLQQGTNNVVRKTEKKVTKEDAIMTRTEKRNKVKLIFHRDKNEGSYRRPFHKINGNKNEVDVITKMEGLIVDKLDPEKFNILEIPISKVADDFTFSNEALEIVAGNISSNVDITKIKKMKGNEAQNVNEDNDEDEYMMNIKNIMRI